MKRQTVIRLIISLGLVAALALPAIAVLADGTETLGVPSIGIVNGSGHVAAGTGLISQPGTINLSVPAGSLIKQVLLYWEGHGDCGVLPLGSIADCRLGEDISINGNALTGQLIGGPTHFYTLSTGSYYSLSYRVDITSLGLVAAGNNALSVAGVSFDASSASGDVPGFANGASVVVIYDDGSTAEIGVRDGDDNAFINFAAPLDTTVPQTFTFAAESLDRTANLTLLVGSVESPETSPTGPRSTRVTVTVNGVVTHFDNQLVSSDGETWDTLNLSIPIPAGASSLTVHVVSVDGLNLGYFPASLSWVAATLSVPVTPTNGAGAGTPGYWKNHPEAWPVDEITIGGVTYTKDQAIAIIESSGKKDKTHEMFEQLVAAKLNVAIGADSSCIADTIAAADSWMATYGPVGSGVKASSAAWKAGEPLKNTLDDYNNGKLCAPARK